MWLVRTIGGSDETTPVQQYWDSFVAVRGLDAVAHGVWEFGDNRELADELAGLVVAGTKRGTTSLLRTYRESGEPLPKLGDFSVVVDGSETPCCIVRTAFVDVKPLGEVDARFAWDEGEGDRSLTWWLSAHTRYFARQGQREGFAVDDRTEVVLVRFEVVWPPELADPAYMNDIGGCTHES